MRPRKIFRARRQERRRIVLLIVGCVLALILGFFAGHPIMMLFS